MPGDRTMGERPHVWVRFEDGEAGGMFVCGDEDGEFARATSPSGIVNYVYCLIVGPGPQAPQDRRSSIPESGGPGV